MCSLCYVPDVDYGTVLVLLYILIPASHHIVRHWLVLLVFVLCCSIAVHWVCFFATNIQPLNSMHAALKYINVKTYQFKTHCKDDVMTALHYGATHAELHLRLPKRFLLF